MTFLIIDDSYMMQEFLTGIIKENRRDKHDTFINASNGEDALDVVRTNSVDMILVDWNMPGLNGLEFTETVRGKNNYKKVPIIMISSEQHKDLISQALSRGATDYITKPVNALHLWEKIKKYLDE